LVFEIGVADGALQFADKPVEVANVSVLAPAEADQCTDQHCRGGFRVDVAAIGAFPDTLRQQVDDGLPPLLLERQDGGRDALVTSRLLHHLGEAQHNLWTLEGEFAKIDKLDIHALRRTQVCTWPCHMLAPEEIVQ
jgi:hypothetical protein